MNTLKTTNMIEEKYIANHKLWWEPSSTSRTWVSKV